MLDLLEADDSTAARDARGGLDAGVQAARRRGLGGGAGLGGRQQIRILNEAQIGTKVVLQIEMQIWNL